MTPRLRFDFADAHGRQPSLVFTRPERVIVAHTLDQVQAALQAVEEAARSGLFAAGLVSYEAAPAFDAALAARAPAADLPLVWFGVFRSPGVADRAPDSTGQTASAALPHWLSALAPGEYAEAFAMVKDAIAAGDSYQANYTFRLQAALDASAFEWLYEHARRGQRPPPYSALLDLGEWRVLSLSPELFFRLKGRQIATRPMKGTAARGLWSDDDARRAAELAASPKNRAENVMIVDLVRNDLARVCEVGSVQVASLFDIERYPSVLQMVSTVEGRLRPETSLCDLFGALFPAGSITGAPKTSSMRLIGQIERTPRGVYCGAIGYVAPGGDAVFNVAIRTAVANTRTNVAVLGVGGGITWDSTVDDEYAEAISKSAFLSPQPIFELLETFRLESGVYLRIDQHLRRLHDSARYFDFPWSEVAIRDALVAHAALHRQAQRRVRVRLSARGEVFVESEAFTGSPASRSPVAVATTPVDSSDRFLYHKTTHRLVYDEHRRAHPRAFDVLLWNERRELTEFTIGNVVAEVAGVRWTPPRRCGLLAGVFRGVLLDRGEVRERVLAVDDIPSFDRIWLVNSLREWVEVVVAPEPDAP